MGRRKLHLGPRSGKPPALRFLDAARQCRARDLQHVTTLCQLVKQIGALIHSLQKERGASSIFLGSRGAQFDERLSARTADSHEQEALVQQALLRLDDDLYRLGYGARFYGRIARAFEALDSLPATRAQIRSLAPAPQDAVKWFTDVIACQMAVVFEIADIATDPALSRALIALVNLAQGKEYAGQERAMASAAFARGHFTVEEHQRLEHLAAAQDHAFDIFLYFAAPAHIAAFEAFSSGVECAEVRHMRAVARHSGRAGALNGITAGSWYEQTTRRIDALKALEDRLVDDLTQQCDDCAAANEVAVAGGDLDRSVLAEVAPLALLVTDVDPAHGTPGLDAGIGLYSLDAAPPKSLRSILNVLQLQSRRIQEVSSELVTARNALTERKVIERAKGLLMKSRGLTEDQAYSQIRDAAMNQNKRIFEVSESIVSMAELLLA